MFAQIIKKSGLFHMGDKSTSQPLLGKDFALNHGALKIDANFSASKIGVGEVMIFENDRIEPTQQEREKRFGMSAAALDVLPPDVQKKMKHDFVKDQMARFQDAYDRTVATYHNFLFDAQQKAPLEVRDIAVDGLEVELMMLETETTKQSILERIGNGESVEVAVDGVYEDMIVQFRGIEDEYFRKTAIELDQHRAVMQHHLHPDKTLATFDNIREGSVVVSSGIPLSAISNFEDNETGKPLVRGVITNAGSLQSHASILIQSMGIPFARISEDDVSRFKNGDNIIMDGRSSSIILHPSKEISAQYAGKIQEQNKAQDVLLSRYEKKKGVFSLDGQKVNVHANFALSNEAHAVRRANPAGIGLYRTEIAADMRGEKNTPTVEIWKNIIKANMSACASKQDGYIGTTVRTIDMDGDKSELPQSEREEKQARITKSQMRALAMLQHELGEEGRKPKLKVMIPMISSNEHMQEMQKMMDEQAAELGVKNIKLGCMVEVPALLSELDTLDTAFMSVGSNDLIHSILGIDRYDEKSIKKYDPTNKAVLSALKAVTFAGDSRDIPVSICGNMASNPKYTPLLLGAGFRNMSCGIDAVPVVKEISSRIDIGQAQNIFEKILHEPIREKREEILAEFNKTHLGLHADGTLDMNWTPPDAPAQELTSEI